MNPASILLRASFCFCFCLAAAATSARAEDAPAAPAPKTPAPADVSIDVRKGDQWVYENRDGLTGELRATSSVVVAQLGENEIDTRLRTKNVANGLESATLMVFDRQWRKLSDTNWTNTPYQENWGVPAAIKVGANWENTYAAARANPPGGGIFKLQAKVVGWERVSLPAGAAYDAFRIEYLETALTDGKETPYLTRTVVWFAPQANRYVKRETESFFKGKKYDGALEVLTGYVRHDVE